MEVFGILAGIVSLSDLMKVWLEWLQDRIGSEEMDRMNIKNFMSFTRKGKKNLYKGNVEPRKLKWGALQAVYREDNNTVEILIQ